MTHRDIPSDVIARAAMAKLRADMILDGHEPVDRQVLVKLIHSCMCTITDTCIVGSVVGPELLCEMYRRAFHQLIEEQIPEHLQEDGRAVVKVVLNHALEEMGNA